MISLAQQAGNNEAVQEMAKQFYMGMFNQNNIRSRQMYMQSVQELARVAVNTNDGVGMSPLMEYFYLVHRKNVACLELAEGMYTDRNFMVSENYSLLKADLESLNRQIDEIYATPAIISLEYQKVDKLVEMIAQSKKPMLICGGGVVRSRSHEEFREFARRIDAPVAITLMGAGGIAGRDPLATGMIGMHGSKASNMACDGCDLIIGNARQVLELLNRKVPQYDHSEWKKYVFSFPTETAYDENPNHLTPKQILNTIADLCPEDSIVSTDVGQHQMWAIQHFHFDYPGQLLTSGGFGTMGFGLGAAIGAKLGNPDKTVIHITGDGCFRMNGNELSTEEFYKTPVITFIFNNHRLGMVRQWQELIYENRFSQTTTERGPDFAKLAEANGLKGRQVTTVEELESAIQEALEEQKKGLGYVVDCIIEETELVRPMVNGGTHITEFLVN